MDYGLILITVCGLVVLALQRASMRRTKRACAPTFLPSILVILLCTAGANIVMYLTFVSPAHAMAAKYPAMSWPFLAFVPVALCFQLRRAGSWLMVGVVALVLAAGVLRIRETLKYSHLWSTPSRIQPLEPCDRMLVDHVGAGWLQRVLWFCPPDRPVFAATQEYLLDSPESWTGNIGPRTLYVSPKAQGPRREKTRRILEMLSRRFGAVGFKGFFWNTGSSFAVLPEEGEK